MAKKKRKNPMQVSPREWLGEYYEAFCAGEAAERRSNNTLASFFGSEIGRRPINKIANPFRNEGIQDLQFRTTFSDELWIELRDWWPIQILRNAAQKEDSEGYKKILDFLLMGLGVKPPAGVLTPWKGKPGRVRNPESEQICKLHAELGTPSLSKNVLAQKFYGAQFTAADGPERRRMRDRCRQAVERSAMRRNSTSN